MSGFAILANTTFTGVGLPAFGEIVAPEALLYGSRVNSVDNNIDLSDNEHMNTMVLDAGYSAQGLTNGTGDGYVQTSLDSKNLNSFTMLATLKLDLNAQSSYNSWAFGNYISAAEGGIGLYIRSESDPNNAGKYRVIVRAAITRKRVADGVFGQLFVDLPLLENLTVYPDTLGWQCLAISFDVTTRLFSVRNLLTNQVVLAATTDAEWLLWDFTAPNRNANPSLVPNHRLMYAGSNTLDNNNNIVLSEQFVWSRPLTSGEFTEQLLYSRKFMLNARGVTLP